MAVIAQLGNLPAWGWMWLLAGFIFMGCKLLALSSAPAGGSWRRTAFLLAWPGMDAAAFLHGTCEKPRPIEWVAATAKTALGTILYFGLARQCIHPLAAGWTAMVGLIFMLHFGGFHLLSAAWRSIGVCAQPIMKMPLAARSLGDFWGRRWNLAFNELAERFVFKPFVRRVGVTAAGIAAFVASGLIHELVISVPAMGGWGLPTAYFTVQGLAAAFERSRAGRRLGLRQGWRGRAYTLLVVGGPAFFLFHPPFVRHIILPMMEATGAR